MIVQYDAQQVEEWDLEHTQEHILEFYNQISPCLNGDIASMEALLSCNINDMDTIKKQQNLLRINTTLLLRKKEMMQDDLPVDALQKLATLNSFVTSLYTICQGMGKLKTCLDISENQDEFQINNVNLGNIQEDEEEKLKPYQKCKFFCYQRIEEFKWKRINDSCYKEMYVCKVQNVDNDIFWVPEKELNPRIHNILCRRKSFFWEKVVSIKQMISEYIVHPEMDEDIYKELTKNHSTYKDIVNWFLNSWNTDHPQFPLLEINHKARSFRNGVLLFTRKGSLFLPYDTEYSVFESHGLKLSHTVGKYIDMDFDALNLYYRDPIRMYTPCFDSIFEYQNLSIAVTRTIMGLLGRLISDRGEKKYDNDNWQVCPFFKGVAQSGKSTICDVVMWWFETHSYEEFSSNIEPQFGLKNLYDKRVNICREVTHNFNLRRNDLQSMISGETVSVSVKHGDPIVGRWKPHLLMAGNEIGGGWFDCAGAIARRIIPIQFHKTVKPPDGDFERKLKMEIGAVMAKCFNAYISMLDAYGDTGFWESAPSYFMQQRRELEILTNPIKAFIRSNLFIIDKYDENDDERKNNRMRYNRFVDLFKDEHRMNRAMKNIDQKQLDYALEEMQLRIQTMAEFYNGKYERIRFILGITESNGRAPPEILDDEEDDNDYEIESIFIDHTTIFRRTATCPVGPE